VLILFFCYVFLSVCLSFFVLFSFFFFFFFFFFLAYLSDGIHNTATGISAFFLNLAIALRYAIDEFYVVSEQHYSLKIGEAISRPVYLSTTSPTLFAIALIVSAVISCRGRFGATLWILLVISAFMQTDYITVITPCSSR